MSLLESLKKETFVAVSWSYASHVLTVKLNRPERKNALNGVMINELIHLFDLAKKTRDVRVVVLAAEGNVFCAGGDLKAIGGEAETGPKSSIPHLGESDDMVVKLYHLNKPVIAKIQGPVLAGALLLVCNATHAIASDEAWFSAPEIKRGLWPFQVMAGLFRIMPGRAALDFIMRGNRMPASDAARLGLINETAPIAELDARVCALAEELASYSPQSMQMGLEALRVQETMSFDDALPFLKNKFFDCVATDDAQEGLAAFAAKRSPEWD